VLDDHSRVAYTEVRDDETGATAVDVLQRAAEWFANLGVTIERVLSDNGALTDRICGETRARRYRSLPSAHVRTVLRRTARSSVSTGRWPTDGPMPAAIGLNGNGEKRSKPGSTTTTSTDPTRHEAISRPSRDCQRARSVQLAAPSWHAGRPVSAVGAGFCWLRALGPCAGLITGRAPGENCLCQRSAL
jgi:hypothetical protein